MSGRRGIFSIGHSTLPYEQFLKALRGAGVDAVADLRTAPYSRHFPHFNQDELRSTLKHDGVAYSFLGEELGGRPKGSEFYCDGVADYEKMATTHAFKNGINRILSGTTKYSIALMCSEKHPLDCHRCLLVGRELLRREIDVQHIMPEGVLVCQTGIETQLLEQSGHAGDDLFAAHEERLTLAYRRRARKVAFSISNQGSAATLAAE